MRKALSLLLLLGAAVVPALAQRYIGDIEVSADSKTIPVRVTSAAPELRALALRAFGAHGRYRLVASGYAYDIAFAPAGSAAVRVTVTKGAGGAAVLSEVVSAPTANQALLRAADLAVEKTNGLGLRGFFSSRLAFISERTGRTEVYDSDLFFSPGEVKQLTHDRAEALFPRWSPDGARIIYTSFYKGGMADIYLLDAATGTRTSFASFQGTNLSARFSPSGRQVAMVLTGSGTPEIWTSNAEGRDLVRRTHSDTVKASPCYSPDGTRLIYACDPGPQLYIMPAAGGPSRRVTSGIYSYCAEPDWSRADPNKVAYTIRVAGGRFQIAVLDLAKGTSQQVVKAPFDGVEPSWLPDGRHLVYTARDRSTSELCILDTETGKSTPIAPRGFGATLQASVWMR